MLKEVLSGCLGLFPRPVFHSHRIPRYASGPPSLESGAAGTDQTEVDSLGFSRTLTGDARPRGAPVSTRNVGTLLSHLLHRDVLILGG